MKLDKIKFARLISYLSRNAGGCLTDSEVRTIDELIDVDVTTVEIPIKTNPADVNELMRAIHAGEKIAAIKAYRTMTGFGLKEAKDAVEEKWVKNPNTYYTKQQMLNKAAMKPLTIEEAKAIDNFIETEFRH